MVIAIGPRYCDNQILLHELVILLQQKLGLATKWTFVVIFKQILQHLCHVVIRIKIDAKNWPRIATKHALVVVACIFRLNFTVLQ
jgi:hypothetical protein